MSLYYDYGLLVLFITKLKFVSKEITTTDPDPKSTSQGGLGVSRVTQEARVRFPDDAFFSFFKAMKTKVRKNSEEN